MSVLELAERFSKEAKSGFVLDWNKKRDEIFDEHKRATTPTDRIACLTLYKIVMDAVEESGVCGGDIEIFKKARLHDYRLLLVQEAVVGCTDGIIDPYVLAEITHREVREGRMDTNDSLHQRMIAEISATPESRLRAWLNRWR